MVCNSSARHRTRRSWGLVPSAPTDSTGCHRGRRQLVTVLAVLTRGAALFIVSPIRSPQFMFGTFLLAILPGLGRIRHHFGYGR